MMRKSLLALLAVLAAGGVAPLSAAEAVAHSENEWRTMLKGLYSAEMTRGEVERKLGANVLFEFTDRIYGTRRDVYYDLGPDWTAFYIYRTADGAGEYDRTDPSGMIIAARPLLIRRYPKFLDDLKLNAMPLSLPTANGQIFRRDTYEPVATQSFIRE